MKTYKLNILAICTVVVLFMACKKDKTGREALAEGRVTFDLPASTDVVVRSLDIRNEALLSLEMKATLQGDASSDVHHVTFATDTTKIADYRLKYGATALLLPTMSYLYYKPTVSIPAGSNVSESGVLNFSVQTSLRARSTYVLPLVIASVDGQTQDPKTRKVIYYVFNTGEATYVDHAGYTVTATASSTLGVNAPARAVDAATGTTFWASSNTVPLPQWLSIDFGRNVTFPSFDYFFPTAITPAVGGYTTSAKVETSSDNITWVDKGTYAIDVNNTLKRQTINMPSLTTARYLRFTILTATPYNASATVIYNIGFVSGILLRN
ncbi:discoidin domain-containing protein [Pedobacter sp. MC2016-24]|uniref:discoidin domain-containing protein n=1 Tax=Pedobacter sp. MC2016-24 TaxID=2780090 RepID=UPI001881783D|nr:discoidin domain-containing protein [Pedobacter sp. MC2016-24]MBE9602226.1 discoidin domain-containing protein [Pedobacter sp. MC2016-24]